jgi:predicted HTH transcriptional regulator
VEETDGKLLRPVLGFNSSTLEHAEQELLRYCNMIQPSYFPRLSLEEVDGKYVLVVWVPAGANRPYKVPDDVLASNKTLNSVCEITVGKDITHQCHLNVLETNTRIAASLVAIISLKHDVCTIRQPKVDTICMRIGIKILSAEVI